MADDVDRLDDWLHARLRAAAGDAMRVPLRRSLDDGASSRRGRRSTWPRRHWLALGLAALNAATFAIGYSLSHWQHTASAPEGAAAAPASIAAPHPVAAIPLRTTLRGDPSSDVGALAVAAGAVWVVSQDDRTLVRIDPVSDRIVARIPVGPRTVAPSAPATPTAVAGDAHGVWVTDNADAAIERIDPATNVAIQTIRLGSEPTSIAVAGGVVWVTSERAQCLIEVDPSRGVVRRFTTGRAPQRIVIAAGDVWVVNKGDGTVSRLTPATGVLLTTAPGHTYDYGYVGLAVDGARVWALDRNRGVIEPLDAGTLRAGAAIGVGAGGRSITIESGVAWVITDSQLVRVDLAAGRVTSSPLTGAAAIDGVGHDLWVESGDRGSAQILRLAVR